MSHSTTVCPVCATSELTSHAPRSTLADWIARLMCAPRTFFEMQGSPDGFQLGGFIEAMSQGTSEALPVATSNDRICPYCRRGYVTRMSPRSIWLDAPLRVLGMCRIYFETSSRRGFSVYNMLVVMIDGEEYLLNPQEAPRQHRAAHIYEDDAFRDQL